MSHYALHSRRYQLQWHINGSQYVFPRTSTPLSMVFSPRKPLLALLAIAACSRAQGSQTSCEQFTIGDIPNVNLTGTVYYPANTLVNISNVYSSINVTNLPAFCRAELTIITNVTAGSFALTEVWLPDDWNGRVLTVGNGGLAGGGNVICSFLHVSAAGGS